MPDSLLSLDVWDTLLRRKCHPDEVKLFTARYIWLKYHAYLRSVDDCMWRILEERLSCEKTVGARQQAMGRDDEYPIEDVFSELAGRLFLPDGCHTLYSHECGAPFISISRDELVRELVDVEVSHEKDVAYLDNHIQRLLRDISGLRVAFVSDFYIGSDRLSEIVSELAPTAGAQPFFVSCDHGVNKRSGRLYSQLHHAMGVTAAQHVHVGDDEWADVRAAADLQIRAILYKNPTEERLRQAKKKNFASRQETIAPYIAELARALADLSPRPTRDVPIAADAFRLGCRYSPLFFGFVLFSIEHALRQGAPAMYYFTREGETFAKIHRIIQHVSPLGVPAPQARILEVSRLATFFPSMAQISARELMRVWNLYSRQSMSALFRTLNVPEAAFSDALAKHDLDMTSEIRCPWEDSRVKSILQDESFVSCMEELRLQQRKSLMGYLAQEGIHQGLKDLFVVDIGWRGTIQDNLACLLPETRISACYLGLQRFLNEQPRNTRKRAFGPDQNYDDRNVGRLIDFVAPLEMLMNSPSGSVVGYTENDGKVRAVRRTADGENTVHERFIRHFQSGVFAGTKVLAKTTNCYSFTASELRPYCLHLLAELICRPPRLLAKAFFVLSHDETFGVGGYVDKTRRFPVLPAVMSAFSRRWRGEFIRRLEDTTWPQGFLRLHRLGWVCSRYNRRAERSARNATVDEGRSGEKARGTPPGTANDRYRSGDIAARGESPENAFSAASDGVRSTSATG